MGRSHIPSHPVRRLNAVPFQGDENRKLRQRIGVRDVAIAGMVVAAIGVGLLYVSGHDSWWVHRGGAQQLLSQIGSLLIVSVALAALWEWRGRHLLAQEVLETARLGADVTAAGLTRLTNQYIQDVEWAELFTDVKHLDIFVAYARTWRGSHFAQLQDLGRQVDARIRVVLPDPGDDDTVARLALRFEMTPARLVELITEAARDFRVLAQPGGADVQLYFHTGDPTFSYYRFDTRAVVTLYSHSRHRQLVPTLVCKSGGTLYDFLRADFEALVQMSQQKEVL
jgi:hypothetical protein